MTIQVRVWKTFSYLAVSICDASFQQKLESKAICTAKEGVCQQLRLRGTLLKNALSFQTGASAESAASRGQRQQLNVSRAVARVSASCRKGLGTQWPEGIKALETPAGLQGAPFGQ